jgi:hypothetical protein
MNDLDINIENHYVQKLNKYDVIEFILESDNNSKIKLLNIIVTELGLMTVQDYANKVGKSYNGVKKFGNTINIAGKLFVINEIKDN